MFHSSDGLFFQRNDDGAVTIIKTSDAKEPGPSNVMFTQTLNDGAWVSAVLTMTAFNERPGDWHAFMKHHNGTEDILAGKRGGY